MVVLLAAHASVLGAAVTLHVPIADENAHLAAGISHWELRRFDLFKVNPPLARMLGALPTMLGRPETDYRRYSEAPGERAEFRVGNDFARANRYRIIWLIRLARWSLIPLALLGGYVCYRWARDLFGRIAGLAALTLWCFSPNVLAYAAVLTSDAASATLGVVACYAFWRWLKDRAWDRALVAGVALGLAELTKTTWVVLFAIWPALLILWQCGARPNCKVRGLKPGGMRMSLGRTAAWIVAILGLALFCINAGYDFEGSGTRLRDYVFVSRPLVPDSDGRAAAFGNRFAKSWVGRLPVPLPRAYVEGIDLQWHDIEGGKPSYLRGRWQERGWWYWYLYALAVKVPLGTLGLFGLAVAVRVGGWWANRSGRAQRAADRPHPSPLPQGEGAIGRHPGPLPESEGDVAAHPGPLPKGEGEKEAVRCGANWRDEIVLVAPAVAVLVLVSSQTGFSRYIRYVLPMFPFVFIWISSVFSVRRPRWIAAVAWVLLSWSVGSSLWYAPHWMSYFNELAGGPLGGPRHLIDAQVDWGQDLLYLKNWIDAHPEARPLPFVYFGTMSPKIAGVDFVLPPKGTVITDDRMEVAGLPDALASGWYAISVNFLYGYPDRVNHEDGRAEWIDRPYYSYFRRFQPAAYAGYSIYIYHLTAEDIEAARERASHD